MSFKRFLTLVILALQLCAVQVNGQCQTYCSGYSQALGSCAAKDGNVDGNGPITSTDVACMCVTATLSDMANCFECNGLTGDDLGLLDAWIITCATDLSLGPQDAVQCWNEELLNGETGDPCYQGPSTTAAATSPPTSTQPPVESPTSSAVAQSSAAASSAAVSSAAASSAASSAAASSTTASSAAASSAAASSSTPSIIVSSTPRSTSTKGPTLSTHTSQIASTVAPATTPFAPVVSGPTTTATAIKNTAGHVSASQGALFIGVFILSLMLY